jgi:hypothetical protein
VPEDAFIAIRPGDYPDKLREIFLSTAQEQATMNNQAFPAAAKSLIETSRNTLVNAIDAGRQGTHRTLETYDKLFKSGIDTVAQAPVAITNELRDSVVAVECQLNLIASLVAQSAARQATEVANGIAGTAVSAADSFEQVFDLRVMQALDRLGVPAGAVVGELADRIAALALAIERLLKAVQTPRTAPAARKAGTVAKSRSAKTPRPAKRASKRKA